MKEVNIFWNRKFKKVELEELGFKFEIEVPNRFCCLFGNVDFKDREFLIRRGNILNYKIFGFWIWDSPIKILKGNLNFRKVKDKYIYLFKFQDCILVKSNIFKLECWGWKKTDLKEEES